ncbi:MAG TPA: hypothetical protein VJM32_00990 [Candidatus Saccharimonadales bacterium]|nr:hypothetical protein [Candidatus Saccharimonadales bacterium]
MSYRTKYIISVVVLVVGCLFALDGSNQLRSSFGAQEAITQGLWKLGVGVVLVAFGAPLFHYYRERKRQQVRPEDAEVIMLAKLGEQRLKAQEKDERERK